MQIFDIQSMLIALRWVWQTLSDYKFMFPAEVMASRLHLHTFKLSLNINIATAPKEIFVGIDLKL